MWRNGLRERPKTTIKWEVIGKEIEKSETTFPAIFNALSEEIIQLV